MAISVNIAVLQENDDKKALVDKVNQDLLSLRSAIIKSNALKKGNDDGSSPPPTPGVTIPTKLSEFINDVGYINTEIDPTVYPISYDDIMNL